MASPDNAVMRPLGGRVALVTGSTDGIGLATARALAAQGCTVLLNGLGEPEAIATLCADLAGTHGVVAEHLAADLRDEAQAAGLVPEALRRHGRLDVLVNNAGTQHKGPIETHPPARWREVFALNVDAAFHTIGAALPGMRERGWGRIVNIASVYGLVGGVDRSSYVASKHALVGLSKAVAVETATTPVTCNAICPGDVSTRIFYRNAKLLAEAEGISREAAQQRKTLEAHYAHLLVHGTLHAQGWDHETNEQDALAMEAAEILLLGALGYASPY